ncbi:MAG: ABC transporter permease [Puniceicoccales bacterium]|nr:ABC transporter permease [Puniceicoccales bacterium]
MKIFHHAIAIDFEQMAAVAELKFTSGNVAQVTISGSWSLREKSPHLKRCEDGIRSKASIGGIAIRADNLEAWDSSLINFLVKILKICESKKLKVDVGGMPNGIQKLLNLAMIQTDGELESREEKTKTPLMFLQTCLSIAFLRWKNLVQFFGETCIGFATFFRGKAHVRAREFLVIVQEVSVKALPIVALISFLVGLIIAFISVLQLAQFGAAIYVADLVGIAMMREMGCIMTGVIMSGRTGAAFAATIGTMVVNDEVDALKTTGISNTDFLVLPRIFALTLTMPFLCMFSSFIGILGGMCASIFKTDLTIIQYCTQTVNAIYINDFFVGIVKGGFFGLLIATIGCLKGLECGHSAEDVGLATTSAVVTSITAIITADAMFAMLFSSLGV